MIERLECVPSNDLPLSPGCILTLVFQVLLETSKNPTAGRGRHNLARHCGGRR